MNEVQILRLDHPKISPVITTELRDALTKLYKQANLQIDTKAFSEISLSHFKNRKTITVYSEGKKNKNELYFPKSQNAVVITKSDGTRVRIQGEVINPAKQSFKHLKWSANDLEIFKSKSSMEPTSCTRSLPDVFKAILTTPKIIKAQKAGYLIVTIIKCIDFVLGKLNSFAQPTSIISQLILANGKLFETLVPAILIFTGALSFFLECSQVIKACHDFKLAQKHAKAQEIQIAKLKIIRYTIRLIAAITQIGLGILTITCPQLSLLIIILSILIFIMSYAPECFLIYKIAEKTNTYANAHFIYYTKGIIENKNLSHKEKECAALKFIDRMIFTKKDFSKPKEAMSRQLLKEIFSENNFRPKKKRFALKSPLSFRNGFSYGEVKEIKDPNKDLKEQDFCISISRAFKRSNKEQEYSKFLSKLGLGILA